jgi:hypothetical protein
LEPRQINMAAAAADERIAEQRTADEEINWSGAGNQRSRSVRRGKSAGKGGPVDRPID